VDLALGTQRRDGYTITKSASADLEPGTAERLIGLLPLPKPSSRSPGIALMAAAVCVAEEVEGRPVTDVGQHDAVRQIMGGGCDTPECLMDAWFLDCLDEARTILTENDAVGSVAGDARAEETD
jgi:hypothetical protein